MRKLNTLLICITIIITAGSSACNNQSASQPASTTDTTATAVAAVPKLKEENVTYPAGNVTMHSFVAYDGSSDKKRPAVLIVPEWWGVNDYVKGRARQLAELGYIAMAVDFYGDGKIADNPDSAGKWAAPFYKNPQLAKTTFDAALQKIK